MMKAFIKYYNLMNDKQKKILIYFIVGTVVLIALFTSIFVRGYESEELFQTNQIATLKKTEARDAVQVLKKKGIEIEVRQDGETYTLLTSKDKVQQAKIELISNSIQTSNNRGWSIFDKDKFGKTRFENNIDYIRSIEGEIEIALESLEVIRKAKVHVMFPKKTAFVKQNGEPTLTVVITPEKNDNLSKKQIRSIKMYLLSSLIGLTEKNLKLMNSYGELLEIESFEHATFEKAQKQARWKQEQEDKLKTKIIQNVAPIVGGLENIVTEVTINYNFQSEETQEEIFDPNSKVERSVKEQTLKETDTRQLNSAGGVPGVKSNLENQSFKNNTDVGKKSKKAEDVMTNYEINKKIIKKNNNTFAFIESIGVAVSFNTVPFKTEKEISDIERKINDMVESIINYNIERKDKITVTSSKFFNHHKLLTQSEKMEGYFTQISDFISQYTFHIKYLIILIILGFFYRFVVSTSAEIDLMGTSEADVEDSEDELLKKRRERAKKQKQISVKLEEEEASKKEEIEEIKARLQGEISSIGQLTEEEELRFEVIVEELKKSVADKPEIVGSLIENLAEKEEEEG